MRQAVLEEWEAIPQEWINTLILKQDHWVTVVMQRHGWATPKLLCILMLMKLIKNTL